MAVMMMRAVEQGSHETSAYLKRRLDRKP